VCSWPGRVRLVFGWRSGRGGEGDGVAERFELSDVVAGAAFGVDAPGVVVGAEVVVAQARVGQELPDDH